MANLTAEQRAALAKLGDGEASSDDIAALLADLADAEGSYTALADEHVKLRQGLRSALGRAGIPSNPGWSWQDIVQGVEMLEAERERLAARVAALEAGLRHALEVVESGYEARQPRACGECDQARALLGGKP